MSEMIRLPVDRALAAMEIVAVVAYPVAGRLRDRAKAAMVDWARWRVHNIYQQPDSAPRWVEKPNRTETALRRLDYFLARRLIAGGWFHWQMQQLMLGEAHHVGEVSTRSFARRAARFHGVAEANAVRNYWGASKPVLAMAAAMGLRLAERPPLERWLFKPDWVDHAVKTAERYVSAVASEPGSYAVDAESFTRFLEHDSDAAIRPMIRRGQFLVSGGPL